MTQRILVVDDEPDLLELVRVNLSQAGYQVDTAPNGTVAMERLRAAPPDLLVLDLMLPDLSGTEICKRLRGDRHLADMPVIMLTAKGEEIDRVVGFEVGADDYVTKPFSPRELALRIRAVLQRRQPTTDERRSLQYTELRVDPDAHRCWVHDREVSLTAKEFQLLFTLMRRPGRVFSRDQLLDEVWGTDISVTSRTIDTHLKRLREKLESAGDYIETVRGVGYRFAD
jgi:two-component system phosphate regulon response regulator PhoB